MTSLDLKQSPVRVIARCDADLAGIAADIAATENPDELRELWAREHGIMVERARAIRAMWSRDPWKST